jgi:hypothetical protein
MTAERHHIGAGHPVGAEAGVPYAAAGRRGHQVADDQGYGKSGGGSLFQESAAVGAQRTGHGFSPGGMIRVFGKEL